MKIESLVDIATRYIEELIITGKLNPGEQIKEDIIAGQLDISRPPVREALNSLEGEGLVTRRPRKGAFVSEMTEKDIWEIYTLKAELYAMATDWAIDRITQEQIDELNSLVVLMGINSRPAQDVILNYQKHHRAFHTRIMEIAGNHRLVKFASSLHKQIRRYSFKTLGYEDHLNRSNQYHRQIAVHIAQKDKENAGKLMKEHVLDAMNFLLKTPGIFV
ncbi:GntR family transcriptional regulator [Desulfospira joergensenii]|uniref:GntR family transcriptional regulator n=1 Tax=Desulfospira joergensenii TaxID=53329 RepID=UPI0003B73077|nr:GntR family transcriptional regulator [Desulfospira joergensenii]